VECFKTTSWLIHSIGIQLFATLSTGMLKALVLDLVFVLLGTKPKKDVLDCFRAAVEQKMKDYEQEMASILTIPSPHQS